MNNYWHWNSFILYLLVFLFPIFISTVSRLSISGNKKHKNVITNKSIVASIILAIFLLIFRSETTGTDLIRYNYSFLRLQNIDISLTWLVTIIKDREPLFALLNYVIGLLTNWNFRAFIVVMTIIPFVFVYKSLKKHRDNSIDVYIAILVYFALFYIRSYSMVGQTIALAISLYAYTFLEEKKYSKYWLFSLLAIGIHYTALINVLIYFWAKNDKLQILKRSAMLFAFIFIMIYGETVFSYLFNSMGNMYNNMEFSPEFGFGNLLVRLPILVMIILLRKRLIRENPKVKIYLNIYYLDIIISQLKYFNVQFERLTMYTMLPLIVIIPVLYSYLKKKIGYGATIILVFTLIVVYIISIYNFTYLNPYDLMPYRFMWNN